MDVKFLLPHKCKRIGWIILALGIAFALVPTEYKDQIKIGKTEMAFTILSVLLIVGGMIVSLSKEKVEDEFIMRLRLNSWMLAVFVNYVLLLISVLVIYGMDFFYVFVYNMFTILIIFILCFHYQLYKYSRRNRHEE